MTTPEPSPIASDLRLDDLIAAITKVHDDPLGQLIDADIAEIMATLTASSD
mgnify:CR=1 FL=1